MPLFNVEVEVIANVVVHATDHAHALRVAHSEAREIMIEGLEVNGADVSVVKEVKSLQDCPPGWQPNCYPYSDTLEPEHTIQQLLLLP